MSDFTIDTSAVHEVDYDMTFHAFKFFDTDAVDLVSDLSIDTSAANNFDYDLTYYAVESFDTDAVDLACTVKMCISTGCEFVSLIRL